MVVNHNRIMEFGVRIISSGCKLYQSESLGWSMITFQLHELSFIRRHYGIDMTARELAHYYSTSETTIHETAKVMGLTMPLEPLETLCTPYPFRVARDVEKFSWDEKSV